MTDDSPALSPIDDLLDVLDLKDVGTAHISVTDVAGRDAAESIGASSARVFEGRSQKMPHGRVFGGQVLAQCVMAAGLTVRGAGGLGDLGAGDTARPIHSLHGYFMRPGDDTLPIRFAVEEMRDGNSFSTRRVHAVQKGAPIMSMVCSFQERAGGLDHQDPAPEVPSPEDVRSLADSFRGVDHPGARHIADSRPIELRPVEGNLFVDAGREQVAKNHVWMRAVDRLPDDPLLHAAVLAYASDYSLLEPVLRRHGLVWTDRRLRVASLDHSMWFHRDARADEWLLYAQESPSAISGRGLAIGHMFSREGVLVATTAQEGMVRVKQS
ncbi:acyl-CoA thioesterase [Humibacillus xanthopallidus]|uniref:Acyl-CoA thioesterase 2 n=1 Tax=Humibacillus xanthopallidus TaxID=412689 RepID=A0A543HJT4_9MICO|nr:acyl-CoA thioesterase II [Humibacillus xanthopallidus]TQM58596.1 acyl-CoA thioesterase-2 [Humibacillus xanthopallidus]